MATKHDHLTALARFCRQMRGQLKIVSYDDFDDLFYPHDSMCNGYFEAPFTSAHGLNWDRKIVYVVRGREEVGSIIHEMGHVFATQVGPEDRQCREWDFFGWEYAIARQIGATRTWSRHNGNYNTGEGGGDEWAVLSTRRRRRLLADRIGHAKKIGAIDADGLPRSVR